MTYRQRSGSLATMHQLNKRAASCPQPLSKVVIGVEVRIGLPTAASEMQTAGRVATLRGPAECEEVGNRQGGAEQDSPMKAQRTHMLHTEEAATPPDLPEYTLFLRGNGAHPVTTSVLINGKSLVMEIDTGASVLVISEETYRTMWSEMDTPSLLPAHLHLRTYTGEEVPIAGSIEVAVEHNFQTKQLYHCWW